MNTNMQIQQGDGAGAKPEVSDSPAVRTPPVTVPGPDEMVRKIQERVKAKMAGKPETPPDKPIEKKTGESETEDSTDLNVPAKVLRQLGTLQSKVRELEPKVKDYETIKPDADSWKEAKKLWSGTHEDKVKALALMSGKDGLDELAAIVHAYYASEQSTESGDENKTVAPEMKTVLERLDSVTKELSDLKAEKAKEKENSTKTEAEQNQQRANDYVKGFIEKHKATFELCSRPDNAAEAIELIQDAALVIIDKKGIDIKKMDQKQAEEVYLEALKETESEFEKTGKRFSKTQKQESGFDPDRYSRMVRPHSRPNIVVKDTTELSTDPRKRFEQVLERNRAKYENGGFGR